MILFLDIHAYLEKSGIEIKQNYNILSVFKVLQQLSDTALYMCL